MFASPPETTLPIGDDIEEMPSLLFDPPPSATPYLPREPNPTDDADATDGAADPGDAADPSALLRLGKRKWLGGAFHAPSCTFFGVPAHAHAVLRMEVPRDRRTSAVSCSPLPLPADVRHGRFKYLRGMISDADDGVMVGIPAWATSVLVVETRGAFRVSSLPLPEAVVRQNKRWMYHGAAFDVNQRLIYCIPANADRVLRIDPSAGTVEEVGPDLSALCGGAPNKWYGGIRGADGAVYGMPYNAPGVLRVVPADDADDVRVEILGDYGVGGYKWHGGTLHKKEGKIYAFPSHADSLLVVDTRPSMERSPERLVRLPVPEAPSVRPANIKGYRWAGGLVGADGAVYAIPSDCDAILRVEGSSVTIVGEGTIPAGRNKWQGAVLARDGAVYAIPCDADAVLRIDTRPGAAAGGGQVSLFGRGTLSDQKNKYQGGFLGPDGRIYSSPECSPYIMVIDPAQWDVELGAEGEDMVLMVPF